MRVRKYMGTRRTYGTRDLVSLGRKLYYEKGPSYTLWWFLKEVWVRRRHAVRLEDVYRFHRRIAGIRSKNATWKILKRLEGYNVVACVGCGRYVPLVLDEKIVRGAIDWRRIRRRDQVVKRGERGRKELTRSGAEQVVGKIVGIARILVERGDVWKAVDLIAHTILPIRETGVLVLKINDEFIYFERKTGKMHLVKSRWLCEVWKDLGLPDGVLVNHKDHGASGIIRRLFGSYDVARRLHYWLKELGYFEYRSDMGDSLFYELGMDLVTGRYVFSLYRLAGINKFEKILEVPNTGSNKKIVKKAGPIVMSEHVKEENEGTYFNRSKGMF